MIYVLGLQDILAIKAQKKSPMLLRMSLLMFSMVCGVFICYVCLKQTSIHARTILLELQQIEMPSRTRFNLVDIPYLHFPNPVSFNR